MIFVLLLFFFCWLYCFVCLLLFYSFIGDFLVVIISSANAFEIRLLSFHSFIGVTFSSFSCCDFRVVVIFFSGRYLIYVFISCSFIGVFIVILCGGVYSSVNAFGICLLSFHSFIGVTFWLLLL